MLISFVLIPTTASVGAKNVEMKIHYIDVGQGDSTLIETPNGKRILMDGGPPEAGDKVLNYLKRNRINRIDLVIATHPDIDHIGGLIAIIKKIEVKKVLDSGKSYHTQTYRTYMNEIKKNDIPFSSANQEDYIMLDPSVFIQILNTSESNKDTNNESSIVLNVIYDEVSFLFMADVGIEQERKMMKQYDLEADILKVGHHGSNTSSSKDFIEAVQPRMAILTYSKNNDFGHPVKRVIRNLQSIDTSIYSTAVYGDVVIHTNGKQNYLFTDRAPLENLSK